MIQRSNLFFYMDNQMDQHHLLRTPSLPHGSLIKQVFLYDGVCSDCPIVHSCLHSINYYSISVFICYSSVVLRLFLGFCVSI